MRVRALAAAAAVGLILPAAAASSAQAAPGDYVVTAVHALPSVGAVDVFVGTTVPPLFNDIEFGDVPAIEVAPGTVTNVNVTLPDATTPTPITPALGVTGYTVSSNVSLVAQQDADGAPLLKAYADDLSPTPAGQSRIIVRHAADAGPVSVDANGAQVIPTISNGEEKILTVPAGNYTVDVKAGGVVVPGLTTAGIPLPLTAGFVYIVYAAGKPAVEGDKTTGYDFVLDFANVGQAPAVTATTPSATTATTAPATTTTAKPATTTTRPAIPTAVPAGDGSSGWAGPLGVPALLAITLAVGLALAVGFGMRGNASHRR